MALSAFGMYLTLTREQVLTPAEDIVNDSIRRHHTLNRWLKNRPKEDYLRHGTQLVEFVQLDNHSNFAPVVPGQRRQPGRGGNKTKVVYPYRPYESARAYTEDEWEQNGSDPAIAFKSFRKALMQDAWTDHLNGIEQLIWRKPDAQLMEVAAGGNPDDPDKPLAFSLPAWIAENVTGAGAYLPPGWQSTVATIGTVNPISKTGWRPVRRNYDPNNPYGASGIFQGMEYVCETIKFDRPTNHAEYTTNDDLQRLMIFTNTNGKLIYQEGLRQANDQLRAGPQDPAYGRPVFMGIPVDACDELDSALLAETAGSYDNTAYPDGKPRFFFVNGNFTFPVFNAKKMMRLKGPISGGIEYHDTEAVFLQTEMQIVCRSRRRNGIVAPSA
jgi:hypothetical protein